MTNSGSIWGGQLLFRRCPEFQISVLWRLVPLSIGANLFLPWCYFWKLTAWLASTIFLPTPLYFLTFFLLFGAFGLATIWHNIFEKWHYLILHLYPLGVHIKLMNSFVSLFMLDRLSTLSCLTRFYSLIYNMKLKNDQIRIRQSDLSCTCGTKDKLNTNIILHKMKSRKSGLGYIVCFSSLFSSLVMFWACGTNIFS